MSSTSLTARLSRRRADVAVLPAERPRVALAASWALTWALALTTALAASLLLAGRAEALMHDRLPEPAPPVPGSVPWLQGAPATTLATLPAETESAADERPGDE